MFELAVRGILAGVGAYLAAGLVFAAAFHALGLTRVDPAARGAGLLFRALVTPGLAALWPVILLKWRRAAKGGTFAAGPPSATAPARLRRMHGVLALALAVLSPLLLAAALALRPAPPAADRAAPAALATRSPSADR